MEEEESENTPVEGKTEEKSDEGETPSSESEDKQTKSELDRAEQANKEKKELLDREEKLLQRKERLQALQMVGGRTEAGEAVKKKELNDEEFAQKMLDGEVSSEDLFK